MENIISSKDFTKKFIASSIIKAKSIKEHLKLYKNSLQGKVLTNFFYEPSTRTSMSFQSAMKRLGGQTIELNPQKSSLCKGESIEDTIRVISKLSDVIVFRHNESGIVKKLEDCVDENTLLINAGDGSNEHPTQSLLDLFTIYEYLPGFLTFDGLDITIVGDLLYGRAVHSLIYALIKFKRVKFRLISPKELQLPMKIKDEIFANGCDYIEDFDYKKHLDKTNVLYMTRIQKERFLDINEYNKVKESFCLQLDDLQNVNEDFIIMHPLPRVNEISVEVDNHPAAKYFQQVEMGMYMRMALIYNSFT